MDSARTNSSLTASIRYAMWSITLLRSIDGVSLQTGKACAAAMASFKSSLSESGILEYTCPVAGSTFSR